MTKQGQGGSAMRSLLSHLFLLIVSLTLHHGGAGGGASPPHVKLTDKYLGPGQARVGRYNSVITLTPATWYVILTAV